MVSGSFSGIASKALSIMKKAAPIIGAGQAWLADPVANSGWSGFPTFIWDRLQQGFLAGKVGNPLITTEIAMHHPDKYPIVSGIATGVAGMVARELGDTMKGEGSWGGKIKALGDIMAGYGFSAAVNSIISGWVYLSCFNPHGQGYTSGNVRYGADSASYGDTTYRTRTKSHIRNAAGSAPQPM